MNIFNSLGSNYDFSYVFKSLFSIPSVKDRKQLIDRLEGKYKGKVYLFYKGRYAIEAGLKLLGLPKESCVAINGFTCFVVYKAVKNAGLEVEYLDIPSNNLNSSFEELKDKFSKNPKIKAVIIQNTLGYPSDIEKIAEFCKKNNIYLVEDLAHSQGGYFGDLVCLSFSQDKIIDGVSGGALIVRNNSLLKDSNSNLVIKNINLKDVLKDRLYPSFTYLIRLLYPVKLGKIVHHLLKSTNLLSKPVEKTKDINSYGLTNWHCKMTNLSLDRLEKDVKHRRTIASIYAQNLNKDVLFENTISLIDKSTNIRFPIHTNDRIELINYLKNKGVYISDIWYDAPVAPKKYMDQTDYANQCKNSEKISETILNLPTHKNVSKQNAMDTVKLINRWINTH